MEKKITFSNLYLKCITISLKLCQANIKQEQIEHVGREKWNISGNMLLNHVKI